MNTINLAFVKTYPQKGNLAANHAVLMDILHEIAPHRPDVVITPECFLDGYVVTGPRGEVIRNNRAEADRWTVCQVDLSIVDRVRASPSGHLRDRRDDLYR
jgi:predicted amidohydrolase